MIKFEPNGNIFHIGADELAVMACPCGDILQRSGYAQHRTPEGMKAVRELRRSSSDKCERSPIITDSVKLCGIEYSITCNPDAIIHEASGVTVELIDETRQACEFDSPADFPQCEAELEICAFFVSLHNGNCPITIRLTRVNYMIGCVCSKELTRSFTELEDKLRSIILSASPLLKYAISEKTEGQTSAQDIKFPYPEMRSGQKDFVSESYRAIRKGKRLLVSAPTGIGKTMSALYPAIKALKKNGAERIFYFTSKGTAAMAALSALSLLCDRGLKLRSIGLSAKERLCARIHRGVTAGFCSPLSCKYAKGHYSRSRNAMLELLSLRVITPEDVLRIAEKHEVCPYELSLDTSMFCSVIVCDYNYLFDPSAYLRRYFPGTPSDSIFLLDEAHNLPDRVRGMYTKELSSDILTKLLIKDEIHLFPTFKLSLSSTLNAIKKLQKLCSENTHIDKNGIEHGAYSQSSAFSALANELEKLQLECDKLLVHPERMPESMLPDVKNLQRLAHDWLTCQTEAEKGFAHTIIYSGDAVTCAMRCLDPAEIIDKKLNFASSSVLFSATLEPIEYFAQLTGSGDSNTLTLPSPYEKDNFCVAVMDKISTRYEDRQRTLPEVLEAIITAIEAKNGNYFVFSPSYDYSEILCRHFASRMPNTKILLQGRHMSYEDRRKFLGEFEKTDQTTIGFCVIGGVFSESVDLPGKKLIGCIIIGNGSGALTPERNLLAEYYQNKYESGYEYAYVYPGMNRVLQAAGRVIRDDGDKGIALLIDDRYSSETYRRLMPKHWHSLKYVGNRPTLAALLHAFWEKGEKSAE
jgi:DNA excision repair protein ERCC-2